MLAEDELREAVLLIFANKQVNYQPNLNTLGQRTLNVPGITQNTTEYPLSFVVFQNINFVIVILDSLFKTGKSGTQWYCVNPSTFSVP